MTTLDSVSMHGALGEGLTSTPTRSGRANRKIKLPGGRVLTATPVFDTYWRFACKRQDAFMRRANGAPPPWSDDRVIGAHRFTNAYRASDRVSQYLIRHVQYDGGQSIDEVFFRTLVFKLFNRIETWEHLVGALGEVRAKGFPRARAEAAFDRLMAAGETVYSAAYIMPSPAFGAARKHANHLQLVEHMMRDGAPKKVATAKTMESVFTLLRGYPSLGDFLAFQLTIDLNYSSITNFSEMDFVVAGPGARDGPRKCFADVDGLGDADVKRPERGVERAAHVVTTRRLVRRSLVGEAQRKVCSHVAGGELDGAPTDAEINLVNAYARHAKTECRGDLLNHIVNAIGCLLAQQTQRVAEHVNVLVHHRLKAPIHAVGQDALPIRDTIVTTAKHRHYLDLVEQRAERPRSLRRSVAQRELLLE